MNSQALIYKVQDYGESSKLLYIYTPLGKYTLVAKGVKNYKNNFFHLADNLNLISVELNPDKPMQTLKKGKLVNSYENLKKDYQTFIIVSKLLNVIDKLFINLEHQDRLFNLVVNLLEYEDLELAYLSLLVKLTYSLGYRLTFHNEGVKGFNLMLGRTVKEEESLSLDLDLTLTTYLKLIYYGKEEINIKKEILYKLFEFIKAYYKYHLDYEIKGI